MTRVVQGSDSYSRRMASGVFWLTVQKWIVRITGFVTIAVLTRALTPADFGAVAAASTLLPFFYLLSDLGFAAYIVQAERVDRRSLSTALWFAAVAGIVLCAVLFVTAPALAAVFRAPQVTPVLQVLSLSVVLTSAASVPMALLRRNMRFATIAGQAGVAGVLAQAVAIVMAVTGFGVWALVGQTLVAQAVTAVLAWISARWRPALQFSPQEFAEMARYGGKVLGVEFIAVVRGWGEAAIISAFLGISALGYVNIAQRIVQIVQDLTGAAVVPVSTVAFAKIRGDSARLRSAYVRALRVTYAVMAAPLVLLAVAAPLIMPIVFGDGWAPSYPLAQIYALAGTLTVAAALDNGLFYGLGKPGRWFVYAVVVDAATIAMTLIAVQWGLIAVAWGFLAVALLATVARWILVARLLHARVGVVARPFRFLAVAVIAASAAGIAVVRLTAELESIVSLLLVAGAVLLVYLAVTVWLAPDTIGELRRVLRRKDREQESDAGSEPSPRLRVTPRVRRAEGDRHDAA